MYWIVVRRFRSTNVNNASRTLIRTFDFTLITIHVIFGDGIGDRREEALLLDDVYRTIQNSNPDEQDVILLGDFNLPPEDRGMAEVDFSLDPVLAGDVRTTISDASLYDNFWWDLHI